jgi:hypothetical protein
MTVQDTSVVEPSIRETQYTRRARYYTPENGFTFAWPAVPARQFLTERHRAFDRSTPTGEILLDASDALQTRYPATTPTLLIRYLRIRAGESLQSAFASSGELYYVMTGSGETRSDADTIAWSTGDAFCLPGGAEATHRAASNDCILFVATDEPLLAFARLRAPAPAQSAIAATHWPAEEIERRFESVWLRPITDNTTGHSV